MNSSSAWFEVRDAAELASPCLLIYRERVGENLRRMLAIAGGAGRLRPHIKTHKMREMLELQLGLGIVKFKCATLAEAEMAAGMGVPDLLIAYQPVGPNLARLAGLIRALPRTKFSVICDDAGAIHELSSMAQGLDRVKKGQTDRSGGFAVALDIDVGQHRTGVPAGTESARLYGLIARSPGLRPGGLHAYDGHICNSDAAARAAACDSAFAPVAALKRELEQAGLPVPRIVAGGTPTFGIHARREGVECSPGTCVFWDAGYASKLPDLGFEPAALVLTRLISKPGVNRVCLDLGHKAIAAEMPPPRAQFLNLEDAKAVMHSEEHLVVETARTGLKLGDCLYGIPWHICPTVALYSEAVVIEKGRIAGRWKVAARDREVREA
jgi:D-serine deaminase-like pyridoxal phosphate-dependent protein